jgi:hypothetical protein
MGDEAMREVWWAGSGGEGVMEWFRLGVQMIVLVLGLFVFGWVAWDLWRFWKGTRG